MQLDLPDELRTGIPSVDEQHAAMVELHNEIEEVLRGEHPTYFVLESLARLYQYSRQHFDAEEKLLERYGYEGLEEHRHRHEELMDELRRIVLDYRRDPAHVGRRLLEFVRVWVLRHVEDEDMAFAPAVLAAMEREREDLLAPGAGPVVA
jgi:hemerythrin